MHGEHEAAGVVRDLVMRRVVARELEVVAPLEARLDLAQEEEAVARQHARVALREAADDVAQVRHVVHVRQRRRDHDVALAGDGRLDGALRELKGGSRKGCADRSSDGGLDAHTTGHGVTVVFQSIQCDAQMMKKSIVSAVQPFPMMIVRQAISNSKRIAPKAHPRRPLTVASLRRLGATTATAAGAVTVAAATAGTAAPLAAAAAATFFGRGTAAAGAM